MPPEHPVIAAFRDAAEKVPAYKRILADEALDPAEVANVEDFAARVPVIDEERTFRKFPLAELCRAGSPGRLAGVLTSSGPSGKFAFGLYDLPGAEAQADRMDDALDGLLQVRTRATLLINCLPMGVKVPTRACTLAETSVRADMVTAIVAQFASHYDQIIMVGEAAFIKHVLELGLDMGIDWQGLLIHLILGEEPLAENARKYFQSILGCDLARPQTGLIGSSMGVAELGLNLFFELPHLIALRRALHEDRRLREAVLGPDVPTTPMLFTYDPRRIYVEVLEDRRLVVSTLAPARTVPLIRYETGDVASFIDTQALPAPMLDAMGLSPQAVGDLPMIMVHGRGRCALAGQKPVYPEQVKEGLYHRPELARKTTANFRLVSGTDSVAVKIQLAPGVPNDPDCADEFAEVLGDYLSAPFTVGCWPYADFTGGMALDYERKFDYLATD